MRLPYRSVLLVVLAVAPAAAQEVSGGVRAGLYQDDDRTQVVRTLAAVEAAFSRWHIFARESVDVVSSASIDVRTSPYIDAMTTASALAMSDRRFETTVGGGYDDGRGHTAGVSVIHAIERDYQSIAVALQGSWDLFDRNTTLLGSVHATHNWVSSIFDPSMSQTMGELGFSAGIAQVLSSSSAVRLRYDGSIADGYQASPYRAVRFGDWTTTGLRGGGVITFSNTIAQMPEKLPEDRVRHAVVAEWVQSLAKPLALETQLRLARDSWGVQSLTAGAELRLMPEGGLQVRLDYRYFVQRGADFFKDKYTSAPEMYPYYSSDKELGDERGHLGTLGLRYKVDGWPAAGRTLNLDAEVNVFSYTYPGFVLEEKRASFFGELGARIDF